MQATAKVLVFTAIIFLTVASAGAQIVGVYSDVVSEDCILAVENVPGYVDAYVVATNTGVMGARFAAPVPTCFAGAVYISESNTGIALGNTQTGRSEAHILNYTIFGREVNLASRLEHESGRGRIVIGETTYEHLRRDDPTLATKCVPLEPVTVKGIRTAVKIYEVPWRNA